MTPVLALTSPVGWGESSNPTIDRVNPRATVVRKSVEIRRLTQPTVRLV